MSFIVLQKTKAGRTYAYQTTSRWDPVKGYAVQKRVYLGLYDPKTKTVSLGRHRNDSSASPSLPLSQIQRALDQGEEQLQDLIQNTSSVIAPPKEPSRAQILNVPIDSIVKEVIEPGIIHLVGQIAQDTHLSTVLESVFGTTLAKQLLFLCAYQLSQATPLYLARPWMEKVLGAKVYSEYKFGGEGELLENIGANMPLRSKFLHQWVSQRNHPKVLIYDITSVSTYSHLMDIAERGYNRDQENLAQINLALVHDQSDRLPLFYRVLPGSIADVSTLKFTEELMRELGCRDFHFILDRGFFSQDNLLEMLTHRIGFTMAIPLSNLQARAILAKAKAQIQNSKYAFAWGDQTLYHQQFAWQVRCSGSNHLECGAHLYFDPQRRALEQDRFINRILKIEEHALSQEFSSPEQAFQWLKNNAHSLKAFFQIQKISAKNWRVQRKNRLLTQRTYPMGMNLILTTEKQATHQMVLGQYRSRDHIEKLFDIYKNENGQGRLYISTREQAEGRIFLAFLALIISSDLDRRMSEAKLYKNYTTAEVFAEMAKVRTLRMHSGQTRLLETSRRQRSLLEKLKIQPFTHS